MFFLKYTEKYNTRIFKGFVNTCLQFFFIKERHTCIIHYRNMTGIYTYMYKQKFTQEYSIMQMSGWYLDIFFPNGPH